MTGSKILAEKVPPYARFSARVCFFTLWDCAGFLFNGRPDEKETALKKLESIKEGYEETRENHGCIIRDPCARGCAEYFSGEFDKHEIGKFYNQIKNCYNSNDKKGLEKVIGELKKIVKGFREVYCPLRF